MTDDRERLYSTREVADRLGLHEGHVRRLAKQHGIGALVGKQRVFTEDDIDALQNRNRKPGPKPKDS